MKNLIAFLFVIVFFSCTNAEEKVKAEVPKITKTQRVAVFAGGCFWGLQEGFSELKGVIKTTSGYAGGTTKNPSYEDVNTETTGHAEAVQIVYDPSVISFAQLLDVFL
jgi:peptide-methionine (S)-S-oxide reductase